MRVMVFRSGLAFIACVLMGGGGLACHGPEHACDAYERFARAMEDHCGPLTWDCREIYPSLGPQVQQDLDWCMDCVLEREAEHGEVYCPQSAPLSGVSCEALLVTTLDASCFAHEN